MTSKVMYAFARLVLQREMLGRQVKDDGVLGKEWLEAAKAKCNGVGS